MKPEKILIVGGGAGGASAAARARRLSEEAQIILLERGPEVSVASCGLPYWVGGEILERDRLLVQTPETLRALYRLDVRTMSEVVRIDRHARLVEVWDRASGNSYEERYDSLILCTGAAPRRPAIPGINRPGHFTLRSVADAEAVVAWAAEHHARRAVVVGGGSIGLEMVEQLHRRGLAVSLAEALPQVMPPLDPEMAAWLHHELHSQEIALHLGDGVARFEPPSAGEQAAASTVVLQSGTRLAADLVVLGLGVWPEISLAQQAGLELGPRGGIRVNEQLRTSDPRIWAIGDAIEVRDPITGTWNLVPLAGPANRQGRIVADNLFGRPSRYAGTLGTAVLRLFDLVAACTGASEKALRTAGVEHEVVHLHPMSHAGYYPGAQRAALKLLFAPESGKLMGAQAVGPAAVDKWIDVLATALKAGMTVHHLADLELAYAPPYSSAKHPVNMAGMAAQNVIAGDVPVAQWHELDDQTYPAGLLLDVRDEGERHAGSIPGSVPIPLAQLRSRLAELPRDREIIVYCQTGQRSYNACRILRQHGFRACNLTGGYRTWRMASAPTDSRGVTSRQGGSPAKIAAPGRWEEKECDDGRDKIVPGAAVSAAAR